MNKLLLAAGLGFFITLGGCADKHVEPNSAKPLATDNSAAPNPMGASASAAGPTMGTTPDMSATAAPTMPQDMTTTEAPPKKLHKSHASAAAGDHTVASAATAHGKKYTVKKGDTLSGIAKAHYGKVSAIKKILAANPGLDANKIRVGQKIILP